MKKNPGRKERRRWMKKDRAEGKKAAAAKHKGKIASLFAELKKRITKEKKNDPKEAERLATERRRLMKASKKDAVVKIETRKARRKREREARKEQRRAQG